MQNEMLETKKSTLTQPQFQGWRGVIHHYASHLPVSPSTPIITLSEGNTPLIAVPNLVA